MKHLIGIVTAAAIGVGAAATAPVLATDSAQASRLVTDLRRAIADAGWGGDRWGVMVVSLTSGDTLFAHNADRPLTPASNMKLFTSAAALHYLGAEYRYATYVTATGGIRDGVVEGDLVLYGTGDPTISDRFFDSKLAVWESLADSLRALGVRRVGGDVVGDASYFEGSPVGTGWDTVYITHSYAAQASALSFNENIVTLRVTGGASEGDPASILFVPAGAVPIQNRAVTTTSGRSTLQVLRASYSAPIELEGRVALGGGGLWRAVPVADPAAFAASAFAEVLQLRGIAVAGQARSVREPDASPITGPKVFASAVTDDDPIQVLAVHRSPPLREILAVINQRSHNLYAESVLRSVGRITTGRGSAEGGAAAIAALLEEAGVSRSALRIDDGSGLSTRNRATPQSIVELLAFMAESPQWLEYWETLPEAAVSRGLRRMQETDAAGNLRAKTGTINRVSALSGYVQARNGERLAFSILSNDVPSTWRAKRVEDRIGARLASFDRPAAVPSRLAADQPGTGERTASASGEAAGEATAAGEALAEAGAEAGAAGEAGAAEAAADASRTYVIRKGDTLDGIARSHGISLSELQAANPNLDPRRLIPGRAIDLPGS